MVEWAPPRDYFNFAALVMFCCCCPLGLWAVIKAYEVGEDIGPAHTAFNLSGRGGINYENSGKHNLCTGWNSGIKVTSLRFKKFYEIRLWSTFKHLKTEIFSKYVLI